MAYASYKPILEGTVIMVKVSVIVPVYNQEAHIERCLDSILAQSLKEIEVILVDDGSTDATPEILCRYQQKDQRVAVLRQQNLYAGVARNHGLQKAQGEYVVFWDSDDYFPEDALETLYDGICRCDADICVGDAVKIDVQTGETIEEHIVNWKAVPEKRPFNVRDFPQHIFKFARNCAWNKLYRRSFIEENHLLFSEAQRANDMSFVMKSLVLAEKITAVDHMVAYYQFRNAGSLSKDALELRESVLNAFLETKAFLIESGYWEDDGIRGSFINKAFPSLISRFAWLDNYKEYEEFYNFQKNKALPALEIDDAWVEQMFSDKNAFELSCMQSSDAEEYMFQQFLYYKKRSQQYGKRISAMKDRLAGAGEKNLRLREKIESLKLDKEKRIEKIQKQRERIEAQSEKIQRKNDKIQSLNDRIARQSEKIESQQALLDIKLVKVILKILKFLKMA